MTTTYPADGAGHTSGGSAEQTREIFDIAHSCRELFSNYTSSSSSLSELHARADLQQQRFYVWASYLGVFAPFNASLDKRLEYSDEIRSLMVQMLSVLQRNLKFLASTDHDTLADDKITSTSGLEGTLSQALEGIEASINRLNRLGAAIRKYSVSGLDERVNAFTQRHGDENYTQLARHILRFKYRTATPSLQEHLALSMASRRQRLRYLHRHQSKLASQINTAPSERISETESHPLASPAPSVEGAGGKKQQPSKAPPLLKKMALRRTHLGHSPMHGGRSETNASQFAPTPSVIAMLRRGDGASVVSSSNKSSTFMAEALEDYPDPPKALPGQPEPPCPYCCQPLEERDRLGGKWVRHVNKDLCPFVCLSDKCAQGPHNFQDLSMWAKHMRDAHTTKWPQQIHKPIIWACDIDHDVEEFTEEDQFQQHLASQHSDCTDEEKNAIAESCQMPRKRDKNICPICGYDLSNNSHPESSASLQAGSALSEFAQLDWMTKHVAGHLRQLAFDSSRDLGDQVESASETSLITSEADVANRDSEVRPPSGTNRLDDVSLEFAEMEEASLGDSSAQYLSAYDGQWSSSEIELLSKSPEDLSSSAIEEWSEVREELAKSTDTDLDRGAPDPILGHFLSLQMANYLPKLREVLEPSPFPEDFFTLFNRSRTEGTGDWILQDERLQAWLHGDRQYLWISGAPGVGKSFLTTRLLAWSKDNLSHVAYFYFRDNNPETRSVLQALRDIAYQISESNAIYARQLLEDLHSSDDIRTIPSAFRRLLVDPFLNGDFRETTVYIFLDGVDEANQVEVYDLVAELDEQIRGHVEGSQEPSHYRLQVALIGRPHLTETITLGLDPESRERAITTIRVTPDRTAEDVRSFITNSVLGMRIFSRTLVSFKEEVIDAIAKQANGLFIVAKFMLAEVARKRHPRTILESLQSYPKEISGMLMRSLRSLVAVMSEEDVMDLNEMLSWVACAERALSLGELEAILSLKFGDPPFRLEETLRGQLSCFFELEREDGMTTDDLIRERRRRRSASPGPRRSHAPVRSSSRNVPWSAPVNTLRAHSPEDEIEFRSDKATTKVSFFHNSLKDFFSREDSTIPASGPDPSIGIDPAKARIHILKTCLSTLTTSRRFSARALGDRAQSAIIEYAAYYWQDHLTAVDPAMASPADKRNLGPQIYKMLTDEDVISRWSIIFSNEVFELFTDSTISHLQQWMRDPDVLAGLHAEARIWVSAEVDKSPGILRPIGDFYSRAWLSKEYSVGAPGAPICYRIVKAIALMDEGYSWSQAIAHGTDIPLDERILKAAAWANIEKTPYYHRRLGEAGFTGSENDLRSTAISLHEDNDTGDATTQATQPKAETPVTRTTDTGFKPGPLL